MGLSLPVCYYGQGDSTRIGVNAGVLGQAPVIDSHGRVVSARFFRIASPLRLLHSSRCAAL